MANFRRWKLVVNAAAEAAGRVAAEGAVEIVRWRAADEVTEGVDAAAVI